MMYSFIYRNSIIKKERKKRINCTMPEILIALAPAVYLNLPSELSHSLALSGVVFIKRKPLIELNPWPNPSVLLLILPSDSVRNTHLLVGFPQIDTMMGKVCQDLQSVSRMLCLPDLLPRPQILTLPPEYLSRDPHECFHPSES